MTAVYTHPRCLDHVLPGHPERPDRLAAALSAVHQLEDARKISWPDAQPADPADVEAVHAPEHVQRVARVAEAGGGWLDPDTFVVAGSYEAALCAAGAALHAADDILAGRQPNALVLVRPPGHHATRDRAMGFCLFNNAAIAAQSVIARGAARRVAIVDVDVHHGNGTQEIFYDRADVLYCSTHQYPFYPGTGRLEEVGQGAGEGATINVPLPAGCGDETYLAVTDRVLAPALRRFQPDLLLVSLGFDAHWVDPLANMRLSTAGYGEILARISSLAIELCGGRLLLLLEGGYDLRAIDEGIRNAASLLAGAAPDAGVLGPAPSALEPPEAAANTRRASEIHGLADPGAS